jgi:hypothetical protein
MNTGVTPHTFTVTATGPLVADTTYTGVSGDVLLFTGQTITTQRGPWEIVTQGTTSPATSTVLRRPSWFSGVAKPFIGLVRYGSAYYGFAFLTYGGSGDIIVGTTVPSSVAFSSRAVNATLGTNLFTAYQTFRANGTGVNACPYFFQAGAALMTTPQAHAVEWDSSSMYLTSLFSLSGTWSSASTSVTVTTGSTSGLTVGAAVSGGITGTGLTVASIQSLTTFTLSANPTNSGTAAAFTLASRDAVTTQNSFGTY